MKDLRKLAHAHSISLLGVTEKPEIVHILRGALPGHEIDDFLRVHGQGATPPNTSSLAAETALAIADLAIVDKEGT